MGNVFLQPAATSLQLQLLHRYYRSLRDPSSATFAAASVMEPLRASYRNTQALWPRQSHHFYCIVLSINVSTILPLLFFPVSSPYTSWMVSPSRPLRSLFSLLRFPSSPPFLVVIFALIHPLLPPPRPSYIRTSSFFSSLTPSFPSPQKNCAHPTIKVLEQKRVVRSKERQKRTGGWGRGDTSSSSPPSSRWG